MHTSNLRSVVVGGSGVLGQAIITALRLRGDMVINLDLDARNDDTNIKVDLCNQDAVNTAVDLAARRLGGIDVLINAAGILRPAAFTDLREDDLLTHIDVNLMGSFRAAQAAVRHMMGSGENNGGRIVFVTSIHGQVGVAGRAAYAASKGGIAAMARVMAAELATHNIRVNVLAPGALDGGMQPNPATRQGWCDATPSARVARTQEAANAAVMLTSDDASFINGQVLALDGGASTVRQI